MSAGYILEGVLLIIVGLFGLIGNLAAIIVFSRKRRGQRNFHALMLSLSIFDLIYIIVSILIFSMPHFFLEFLTSGAYFYVLPWALPIAQIGLTGSIYFTMAITVERYFTVCHPFFHLSHSWPAKNYVIPIFSFAFIYNIPKFFEIRTRVPGANNGTLLNSTFENVTFANETNSNYTEEDEAFAYGIEPTAMRLNNYYYSIYCMWLNFFLMGFGPFVLLITLNTLMLAKLKEMAKENAREHGLPDVTHGRARQSLGHGASVHRQSSVAHGQASGAGGARTKEVVLAQVSLGIVVVFIICHSIKWIPNIYELLQVGSTERAWPIWIETVTNFSHLMTTFNSSVNFYIYFAKHYSTILKRRPRSDDASRMVTLTTRLGDNHSNHESHHHANFPHSIGNAPLGEIEEESAMLMNDFNATHDKNGKTNSARVELHVNNGMAITQV